MVTIKGLAGSSGYAEGTAVVLKEKQLDTGKRSIQDIDLELALLEDARKRYREILAELRLGQDGGEANIFKAYLEILDDPVFFDGVKGVIASEMVCASYAIEVKRLETEALFAVLDDDYLKERVVDINNVCYELIAEIQGVSSGDPFSEAWGEGFIVFAADLTPADTVKLDKSRLRGLVTEKGGVTSHTVILAKSLGLPAIVGAGAQIWKVRQGDSILADGASGIVYINPDHDARSAFVKQGEKQLEMRRLHLTALGRPAQTIDGVSMAVNINSGDSDSITALDPDACDGVGLFRTEFIFMNHGDYPGEDAQFAVYKSMAEKLGGKELIIRTLDIGGDKQLAYMDIPSEMNPFLGYRAIRLCLDRPEVFKPQLRAILRAGIYGNIKIMFPMIVTLEELLEAKRLLHQAEEELDMRGASFKRDIPVGIMIETPAAAVISDRLAEHADFFSIGTNDLIQYTTATDRLNEKVQYLYDGCNISVLRLIKFTCDNAARAGIPVGICGETASEPYLIPLWAAMGVEELSVAPALAGRTKYIINQISAGRAGELLPDILGCGEISKVRNMLADLLPENAY